MTVRPAPRAGAGRPAAGEHRDQAERQRCLLRRRGRGTPSRLGAIDGDLCGFPNGRRLRDDVTDIELRALVEGYGPTLNAVLGVPNRTPNNLLGDGVDDNDMPFLSTFPYIDRRTGYEHTRRAARLP